MTTATETKQEIEEALARVAPVIDAHRDEGEAERRLPRPIYEAIRDNGLLRLWTPRVFGGLELDLRSNIEVIEELSRLDSATGWTYANLACGNILPTMLSEATARQFYTSGPDVGIVGSVQPKARAVPVDGGYRLSGRWPLVSGADYGNPYATIGVVFEGEAPRMLPAGAPDMRAFFFPASEAKVLDTWHSLGMRGTGSTDVVVEDIFVSEDRSVSFFAEEPQVGGPLYTLGILPLFSMAICSTMLGIARAAVDSFVELAKAKTPTLSQTGLAASPTIHADTARAEAQLGSARSYFYEAADEMMAAALAGNGLPPEIEAKRRLACVTVGESCRAVVDRVFSLAGTTPIYTGHRLERSLRDIHTASQHLFASPVWWEKTGQFYFGQGLGMP